MPVYKLKYHVEYVMESFGGIPSTDDLQNLSNAIEFELAHVDIDYGSFLTTDWDVTLTDLTEIKHDETDQKQDLLPRLRKV